MEAEEILVVCWPVRAGLHGGAPMTRRTLAFIILFALVAGGCVQGETTTDITSATAAAQVAATTSSTTAPMTPPTSKLSNGCDRELATPGEHEGIGRFGELEQPYWAVVPDSYAEVAPVPLYMHLAAGSGDHNGFLAAWLPYLDEFR